MKFPLTKIVTNEKEAVKSCVFVLNAKINDIDCALLLDTGCSVTYISSKYIKEHLILNKTEVVKSSSDGIRNDVKSAKIEEIRIGEYTQNDLTIIFDSEDFFKQLSKNISIPLEKEIEIDGLIGNDILNEFNAIIDLRNSTIDIF